MYCFSSESSWNSINPTFVHNFRPRECLEDNEFWIPFLDFLRHFSDLVICSSSEPYRGTQEQHERRSVSSKVEQEKSPGDIYWSYNTGAELPPPNPRRSCRRFADGISKYIFLIENVWISLKISMKFVP